MKSVKGTKTEKNLLAAFAGESQARNRYTYSASHARKEGYVQIAEIFEETANHEKEHAKRFFSFLEGGEVEITASYPAGFTTEGSAVSTTLENLKHAAAGEHFEWTTLYKSFAETAKNEGFPQVAALFTAVCVAEKQHEKRYKALAKNVETGAVFTRSAKTVWACMNCGYIFEGALAPASCPACMHPQAYFELVRENW